MAAFIIIKNDKLVYETEFLTKAASYIYSLSVLIPNSYVWAVEFDDIEEKFNLPRGFIDNVLAEKIKTVLCSTFKSQIVNCTIYSKPKKQFMVELNPNFVPNWDNLR